MNSFDDWVVNNLTLAKLRKKFDHVSIDYVQCSNTRPATKLCAA